MKKFFGVYLRGDEKRLSWKIASLYAAIAAFWFLLSDKFLAILTDEPEEVTWLHLLNDWLYVLITAVLLGWVVRRQVRALRREDELMRAMAQGISVAADEAFFPSLTRNLTEVLELEGAFLCEVSGSPPMLRTVAAQIRERDAGEYELDPEGVLLSRLLHEGPIRYSERAREALTGVPLVVELSAECFLGIPLFGAGRGPLGMLAVVGSKPLRKAETVETVLSVFAVRSVIELERRREKAQLYGERDFFAQLLQDVPASLVVIDREGRVRTANERLLQISGQSMEQVAGRDFLATFVPEDERSKLSACLDTLLGMPDSIEIESRLLIGDGSCLPLVWRLRSRPEYIVGLGIPIS